MDGHCIGGGEELSKDSAEQRRMEEMEEKYTQQGYICRLETKKYRNVLWHY